jgi:hypothetical protein
MIYILVLIWKLPKIPTQRGLEKIEFGENKVKLIMSIG